jgi:hypothetical protein
LKKTHKRGTQFHSFIKAKMNSVASYSMSDFMWPEGTHMDFLVGGAQIISKEIILGHKKSIPCLLFPPRLTMRKSQQLNAAGSQSTAIAKLAPQCRN